MCAGKSSTKLSPCSSYFWKQTAAVRCFFTVLFITAQVSVEACCLTLSADHQFFYVGYKYFGIVRKYNVLDCQQVCGLVVNSGDVVTMFEVWPGVIFTSGSDCTVRTAEMTSENIGDVAQFMHQPQQRTKMSVDTGIYREISENISAFSCTAISVTHFHENLMYNLIICQINKPSPVLVRVRNKLTIQKLEATPNNNVG
jgi:hypothetical protein